MTTDERKTLLDIRNQLVFQIERIDALMEIKEQPKPKLKQQRVMSPGLKRIWTIFHKESTQPPPKVFKSYNDLARRLGKEALYSQIETMIRFYSFRNRRQQGETDYWSHDAYTLINNWDKKEATARDFLKGKPQSSQSSLNMDPKIPEPKGDWRAYAATVWTSANWREKRWSDLNNYPDIQKQIVENVK